MDRGQRSGDRPGEDRRQDRTGERTGDRTGKETGQDRSEDRAGERTGQVSGQDRAGDMTGLLTRQETGQEEVEQTWKHDPWLFKSKHLFGSPGGPQARERVTHGLRDAALRQTNGIVACQVLPPMLPGERAREQLEAQKLSRRSRRRWRGQQQGKHHSSRRGRQ